MIEITGVFNTAKCFTSVLEPTAAGQIKAVCDQEAFRNSRIRIMPDVHAGKGCTIGTTMTIRGKAVPNVVGVDIGCGMYATRLGNKRIDFARVDEICHWIPSRMNVWESPREAFDLERLRCYKKLLKKPWLKCSLGTLGGGNHFIEIDRAEDGTYCLVIHSGSRNLGKPICEYYQQLAVDVAEGKEE